jgi:hypothetical protein
MYEDLGSRIIYTGAIDEFFGYKYGQLEYKTTKFKHELKNVENLKLSTEQKGIETIEFSKYLFIFEIARFVKYILRKKIKERASLPLSDQVIGLESTIAKPVWLSNMRWKFLFLSAIHTGRKILKNNKFDLICGLEIGGAYPASTLGKEFGIPVVNKFFGTIAGELIESGKEDQIPHYLKSLAAPANLVIMVNDGTRGKDALLSLGVPEEKIYFRVDGVDMEMASRVKEMRKINTTATNDKIFRLLCLSNHNSPWKRIDRI